MTVLVCGGRTFHDRNRLWRALDALGPSTVVHGGARGADRLAGAWARSRGVVERVYPARWNEEGKAAGVLRNQRMLDSERIDEVLACPGGRGTADMVSRAMRAGVCVRRLSP